MTHQTNAAVAAIEFALRTEEGIEFLRCWIHGDFPAIREEWPDCPEAVFVGAESDGARDVQASDALMNAIAGQLTASPPIELDEYRKAV